MGIVLSAKVSTKHQISIPSEARRRLGIEPGDRLIVEIRDDSIILSRPRRASERLRGLGSGIWQGVDPVQYVRQLRGEWERAGAEGEQHGDGR
jgi:AbrB family looped-hinge helix DNA binding protein